MQQTLTAACWPDGGGVGSRGERLIRSTMVRTGDMQTSKQSFELNAVQLFSTAGGLPQDSKVRPGKDPPDVLVLSAGRRIGIEVRRLFDDERSPGGSPQRRQESLHRAVVDRAGKLHGQPTDRYLYVNVIFNPDCDVLDRRVPELARALVVWVVERARHTDEGFELRSEDLWDHGWPEEVLLVSVHVLEGGGPPEWVTGSHAWVGTTTRDLIQTGLNSKESRLRLFDDDLDERWLLVVCDGSVGASLLDVHSGAERDAYRSRFDRAFVMGFGGKHFVELGLTE